MKVIRQDLARKTLVKATNGWFTKKWPIGPKITLVLIEKDQG